MTGPYDDIIHLPHHVSATRAHMPIADRAAQFSPFAALTGHGAAIKETARLTNKRINLDEDSKAFLTLKLNILVDVIAERPRVSVTYFQPDEHKEGGNYVTATGELKKVDDYTHALVMMDGKSISIEEILEIESEWFKEYF